MNCPHCFEPVPPRSAFCPHCGARLSEEGDPLTLEAADDPTYGPLAQANLSRLRGDWDAARQRTVDVLRAYPNSGTAHSLLGDIYADQDLYEEAAQWYRMALDLEPDNAADARKLAGAELHLKEQAAAMEEPPERPPRLSPLVVVGWAAAAFLVIVIALGLWLNSQRPLEEGPAPPGLFRRTPRQRSATSGATGTSGGTRPPGATGTTSGGPSPTPGTNPPEAPSTTVPPSGTAAGPVVVQSAPVQGAVPVIEALRPIAPGLSSVGLAVGSVLYDPRRPSVMIVLDGDRVNGADPEWITHVYRASLDAAVVALRAEGTLRRATVRVEMPLRAPEGIVRDVAFIGDLNRPADFPAGSAPSGFDRRWWHPGLAPPPALAATETPAP